MAQEHEYVCNGCGKLTGRSMLTVKKILFYLYGCRVEDDAGQGPRLVVPRLHQE